MLRPVTLTALLLVVGSFAYATSPVDVRIEFGGSTPANGSWNVPTLNASIADLLNSNGSSSGIGMSVTDGFHSAASGTWSTSNGTLYGDDNWLSDVAAGDNWYLNVGDTTGAIEFTGLNDSLSYRIDLVASHSLSETGNYTIQGIYADATQLGAVGSDFSNGWNMLTDGATPGDWMVWTEVAPVAGSIDLSVTYLSGGFAMVNAIRITEVPVAVPEPSTLALLLGLSAVGVVISRRRWRAQEDRPAFRSCD